MSSGRDKDLDCARDAFHSDVTGSGSGSGSGSGLGSVREPLSDGERDASEAAFGLGLQRMSDALPAIAPPPSLRARLLSSAQRPDRFARFANTVAELLDVDIAKAEQLIARIDDASAWVNELPGISFLWVEGGPRVAAAIRGFIRIDAGQGFPLHEHLGDEVTFVLQGGFEDVELGIVNLPGDMNQMTEGTSHEFRARPGLDLLMLAVVHNGLRAYGRTYSPR